MIYKKYRDDVLLDISEVGCVGGDELMLRKTVNDTLVAESCGEVILEYDGAGAWEPNRWIHIGLVYDANGAGGSTLNLFINGEGRLLPCCPVCLFLVVTFFIAESTSVYANISFSATCFQFAGSCHDSSSFHGYVDELRLWNVPRSTVCFLS